MQGRKLLIVVNDARFFLSHRLPIAIGASRAGYEVHVATPAGVGTEKIKSQFHFHEISLTRSGTRLVTEFVSIIALWNLLRRLQPHLIHLVTMKPAIYGGMVARVTKIDAMVAAVTGMGHLFTGNTLGSKILRKVVEWTYRLALRHPNATVIFQNPDDLEFFVRKGITDRKKSVLIRGSGVDMSLFVPTPERPGPVVITLASRMLWSKGVGTFVRAARLLKSAGMRARFVLAGSFDPDNPSAVPFKTLRDWNLEAVVEWWGHRDDMPEVMAASHIVTLPTTYGEGVPKVLIEAAAAGRPVIATDAPGCREIVRHGVNGFLIPSGDPIALADAIERLVRNRRLRLRLGQAGRELAVAEFSVERVVAETLHTYRKLLA